MKKGQSVSSSLEDYLEMILRLIHEKGAARARDIASGVGVHRSTVTAALRSLSSKGLVKYAPYEVVTLTEYGRQVAETTDTRHRAITAFLTDVLLLEQDAAERNACRMEHVVDADILPRLETVRSLVAGSTRDASDWGTRFRRVLKGRT